MKKVWIIGLACALVIAAAGCSSNKEEPPQQAPQGEAPAAQSGAAEAGSYTDTGWDSAAATIITLEGSGATIDGTGAVIEEGGLLITQAGTYVLEGQLQGGVTVDASGSDRVQLVLAGVSIDAGANAAIYCAKVQELVITLAEGTMNTVTDASDYVYADEEAEEPNAAIFSKSDLTLNGSGSLTVNAGYQNGILTKDNLVIAGGTYLITAANHGMRGRDSVTVLDGDFTIVAGNDGIQSNNPGGEDKGWISLQGGSYHITTANDGIQAESSLEISAGSFQLLTGEGHDALSGGSDGSYKGLKAGTDLTISGGVFIIDSADDAVHANGDVRISGGELTLATGDDGVHADGDLTITGGVIDITASYEGLEAMTMTIADGDISLVASDDGINVAGGDSSGAMGRFGPDSFSGSSDRWLKITGGTITVTAGGDGIDVNGNAEMTGGTVTVHGPTSGGDGALDYDGSFVISGGVLIAAGSAGMAEAPSSTSGQPSLLLYYTETQPQGTLVELQDSSGAALAAYQSEKQFQTIVISHPEMEQGAAYRVLTDGQETLEVTLEGAVTTISDTGEAVSRGMMGGFGAMGGGRGGTPGQNGNGRQMPGEEPPSGGPTGGMEPPEGGMRPGGGRPGETREAVE